VIGYTCGIFGNIYLRYLVTHIIYKDVNDALKKKHIKRFDYGSSTPHFYLTPKDKECCIKYLEKKGYEPYIMANILKQRNDEMNEIERNECGRAEDDLSAKEWVDIAETELEFEEENKEELEFRRAGMEEEEKENEEIKKAQDKKRFDDLL
jgi:hypothetical protein